MDHNTTVTIIALGFFGLIGWILYLIANINRRK